jgi:hypothetical protein
VKIIEINAINIICQSFVVTVGIEFSPFVVGGLEAQTDSWTSATVSITIKIQEVVFVFK